MDEYYDNEFAEIFRNHPILQEEEPGALRYRRVWLTWENVRFQTAQRGGIPLLVPASNWHEQIAGIWGIAGPGEIVAVAGEDNCGKSLLLNILSGNVSKSRGDRLTGKILVNGEKRGKFWRRICAHVSQSLNDLQDLLSVREHLEYRAELALPAKWNPRRRQLVVQRVLETLDLVDIQNRMVLHLNAGEKRRVKIGQALVSLPRVLLLDDPFSDMDATMAFDLLKNLHGLVRRRQMSVVISSTGVRQAALPFIDKFLLMAQGRMMFYGTLLDAVDYFERYLNIEIPRSGDNPLSCMLDGINCKACRREAGSLERLSRTWQEYAFDKQLYRANYPQGQDNPSK